MAHGLPVGLAAHDDSDERLTGIAHMPETHDDSGIAVSQALSGLGQSAPPVLPMLAMPPRTLKPEEMFARDTLDRRAIQTYAAGYRSSTYEALDGRERVPRC
jgi:hypothetical protein